MSADATYKQLNFINNLLSDTGMPFENAISRLGLDVSDPCELDSHEASQVIEWLLEQKEGSTD